MNKKTKMSEQTKREIQATAIVLGAFAVGTTLSYFALRPSLDSLNQMTVTKLNLVEAYMVIDRMNDLAPEIVKQAADEVHAEILVGLKAAAGA